MAKYRKALHFGYIQSRKKEQQRGIENKEYS